MKRTTLPLILASGSPRRHALLAELGFLFRVIVSDAPEHTVSGLDAEAQAIRIAERKARAVAAGVSTGLVLGADTIVVLDGEILGKPRNDADAADMLRRLSGREHQVVTGIALVDAATGSIDRDAVGSSVCFRSLIDSEIAAYIATGEPRDKAGAYAIQGIGSALIAGFGGCYTNIVGLPLCATAKLLTTVGIVMPPASNGCWLPDGSPCPRRV